MHIINNNLLILSNNKSFSFRVCFIKIEFKKLNINSFHFFKNINVLVRFKKCIYKKYCLCGILISPL